MNLIILGACVLFIFCALQRHAAKASRADSRCEQITKGYDGSGNTDRFVSSFPVDQQHRVLVCLDKLAKRGPK